MLRERAKVPIGSHLAEAQEVAASRSGSRAGPSPGFFSRTHSQNSGEKVAREAWLHASLFTNEMKEGKLGLRERGRRKWCRKSCRPPCKGHWEPGRKALATGDLDSVEASVSSSVPVGVCTSSRGPGPHTGPGPQETLQAPTCGFRGIQRH